MNNNLDHLPASRQNHLEFIVDVIRDEVEQVTGFATGKKKHCRVLKIILFGSHATGKWVNDPAHGYVSDYDILVILSGRELLEEYKIWHTVEERCGLRFKQPLNILVHTLGEVNEALIKGQYFFTDIRKEGRVLYETDKRELAEAGNLTPEEYKAIAEKHFEQWFDSAKEFLIDYQACLERGNLLKAAFELHQATERFYSCLLLVLTNYKPNTHNLVRLNAMAISQDERIAEVFPQETKIQRRRFQLLKHAYLDARYSEHYKISEEELLWLAEQVLLLQGMVERFCLEKIDSYLSYEQD